MCSANQEPVPPSQYSPTLRPTRFWSELFRSVVFLASVGGLGAAGNAVRAQGEFGQVNFLLMNSGPGATFDEAAWLAAAATIQSRGFESRSFVIGAEDQIKEMFDTSRAAKPRETVILLSTMQLDTTDPDAFADMMQKMDETTGVGSLAGSAVLLDSPLCRVLQLPMTPTDYTPVGLLITGVGTADTETCYTLAAELHSRRAQGWDLDANGNRIVAVDPTAEAAQDAMPVAQVVGRKLIDTNDPERRAERSDNIFAPGEEIVIHTSLDYVRKRGAGYPGARFEIELDVEIRTPDDTLIERLEDVKTFEGEVQHRVPVDADYFRNWIFGGLRLEEPGSYKIVFLMTDRMAPDDKQVPVSAEVDVVVK
jgi:hypothetical protein